MPLDTSVFNNIKTFADYQKADQAFQLSKALQNQQLQTGGIDAASKGTMLGAQLQAQASANGDQATYEAGKARAASLGLDTSTWAANPAMGAKQANDTIQAFTPVTKLLSTAAAVDQASATRAGVTGEAPPPSMVQGIVQRYGMGQPPVQSPQQLDPRTITPAQARSIPANGQPDFDSNWNSPAPAPNGGSLDTVLNQALAAPAGQNAVPAFVAPAYDNTKTRAVNDTAFTQAKAIYDARPDVAEAMAAAKEKGTATAKQDAANIETAKSSQDIIGLYKKLSDEAPSVPSGILPNLWASATNAAGAPNAGAVAKGTYDADLNNLYLATIRSLKGTGRVQQSELEKIAEAAPSPNDSMAVKQAKAAAHMQYYQNRMTQLGFDPMTGNPSSANPLAPTYQNAPAQSIAPPGGTLYGTSGGKNVYKLPNGSFVMEQ